MADVQRPTLLTVLGILSIIGGVLSIIAAIFLIIVVAAVFKMGVGSGILVLLAGLIAAASGVVWYAPLKLE